MHKGKEGKDKSRKAHSYHLWVQQRDLVAILMTDGGSADPLGMGKAHKTQSWMG